MKSYFKTIPKKFDKCVREGGRVRRISGPSKRWKVKKGEYRNICWDKKNIPHRGELHKKKPKTEKLITPSDIPKLLKPGMKVINPMKKKSVKKDILENKSLELKEITSKSLKKITDKGLVITHYYLHRLWKNKGMKKITIKNIVISHIQATNEFKDRKLRHYERDTLDWN